MTEVVVLGAVRTPFGKFGGTLKDFTLPDLGGQVVAEALRRAGIAAQDVEEIALGVNLPGSDRSIARQAALCAGIPDTTPAYTVDRACCSSLTAINMVSRSLRLGEARVTVGGGTENMSLVPYFLHAARWGNRLGDIVLKDQLVISCPYSGKARALQAGEEAMEYGIGREEQDRWALRSHQRVSAAQEAGFFEAEILPIEVPQRKGPPIIFGQDEGVRPNTTLEKLAKLRTIYDSPTVTPYRHPGECSRAQYRRVGHSPHHEGRGGASWPQAVGDDQDMGDGCWTPCFAAMPLVATHILGGGDPEKVTAIREKTNVNGGAIAIGHPTGATAARLVMTIIYALQSRGGGWGLVSICGGIGQGESVIVKVDG
jgi:acetyl-CoA C-acetyltransferase